MFSFWITNTFVYKKGRKKTLASHLGHYRTRYGDIPTTQSLHLLTTETITDEIAVTPVSGLEALIEVLKATGAPEGGH